MSWDVKDTEDGRKIADERFKKSFNDTKKRMGINCDDDKNQNYFDNQKSKAENAPVRTQRETPATTEGDGSITSMLLSGCHMSDEATHQIRSREMKKQQKKDLDKQIAERKMMDLSIKNAEREKKNTHTVYSTQSLGFNDKISQDKSEKQRQIHDYNLTMAQQKRDSDKKRRYDDFHFDMNAVHQSMSSNMNLKKDIDNNNKQVEPELVTIERALSRSMFNMNSENNNNEADAERNESAVDVEPATALQDDVAYKSTK